MLNELGTVVGQSSMPVNAPVGQPGNFSGTIAFNTGQVRHVSSGRVELAEISPRDGSVVTSTSVAIRFSCGF